MRVLVFMTQFYELRGAERLAVELACDLNRQGIHADIMSMYSPDLPGVPEATERLLNRGIPNVRFLGMKVHPPLRDLFGAVRRLRAVLREQRYDVVETSQVSPTVIATWATLTGRTRHVAGLHQVFDRARENSWRHRFWRVSARINRRTRYYAISNFVREAWLEYSGTPAVRTRTIYNAIPDGSFDPEPDPALREELSIPPDARIAIYIGRLASYKGCDVLLDALAPVLEELNLYLLYVGTVDREVAGSEQMVERMQEKVARDGLGERVRFLGYREDVPRLLASSQVLTHPTRMEGFGLTLVEALAAGVPVVATDVEGIPEVLENTDSIMVPADDPAAFRQAVIETLGRDAAAAARAASRGRARAEDFRIARRTAAMTALFSEILEDR